jgi:uncharacterized protein
MLADGRIEVEGVARRRVVPELAVWHALAVGKADERGVAFGLASERAAAVLAAVRTGGGEAAETWSEPIAMQVHWGPGRRRPSGYEAVGRIGIRAPIADAELAGQAALVAGAESLEGPHFELADPEGIRDDLLAEAVIAARARAESMATAAGVAVGRTLAITDRAAAEEPFPPAPMRMAALVADAPPVAPAADDIVARVFVRFELMS